MIQTPVVMDIPLHTDKDGVIRVGGTRVTLETIVGAHQRGDTVEDIARGFPTVKLADIHAVISYYLNHQDEVEAYLRYVDEEAEKIRRKFEALPTSKPLTREMLEARLEAKRKGQTKP
jgi:uncharacterized protein (DUF433 family)